MKRNDLTEEEKVEIVILRCATDLEAFARVCFPHYTKRPFNTFHHDSFASYRYGERSVRRARAAPRGSAKSTLATLIKPIHDLCYGLEKFILIFSSTGPLANKKLKDIRNEIQTNSVLRALYGVSFPARKAGESQFTASSRAGICHFQALGRGAEVRGIRVNEDRPTKIVLDDVEFSEEVYNEKTRAKTFEWFFEDVLKAGDVGTNVDFVGTVLHSDALLPKLLKNPSFDGKLYQSIISWSDREDLWNEWTRLYHDLDDQDRKQKAQAFYDANEAELLRGTKVLWPTKSTYLDHMKTIAESGLRSFMKEEQNDPQGAEDRVFDRFHWYREIPEGYQIVETGVIIPKSDIVERLGSLDPATGKASAKSMGDYTCMLGGMKDKKGRLLVHWDWTKRAPPSKYIDEIFESHLRFEFDRFSVETNLYRGLLLENIEKEMKERKKNAGDRAPSDFDVPFYECDQTENKIERITRIEPKVSHGNILLNVALSSVFKQQLEDFPNSSNDDCPDALEQLWSLAHNRYKTAGIGVSAMRGR